MNGKLAEFFLWFSIMIGWILCSYDLTILVKIGGSIILSVFLAGIVNLHKRLP